MIHMGEIIGVGKPITKWYRGIIVRQSCHSHLASDYLHRDLYMNALTVALTAITSSAILTSLSPAAHSSRATSISQQEEMNYIDLDGDTTSSDINSYPIDTSNVLALAAGTIAALNTVLQAVMRTLQYATRGEQHLAAYKQFSKLRFKLENIIGDKQKYGRHENIDRVLLEAWIVKYEEVLESSPIIPQRIFAHVAEDQDKKGGLKWTKEIRSDEDAEAIDAAATKTAKRMIFPGISKISRPSYLKKYIHSDRKGGWVCMHAMKIISGEVAFTIFYFY